MNQTLTHYLKQKISPRMSRICGFVVDGRSTWDLGCDHGLIGLWAWHTHELPELHFVDRAPGVIAQLENELAAYMDLDSVFFHSVDAATLELPSEPCNVILSGVGFRSMKRIVDAVYPMPLPHRVIISVHAEEECVEAMMEKRGWSLCDTAEIEERGRMRSITVWDGRSNQTEMSRRSSD